MLNNLVVGISGGAGKIGSSFAKQIINNNGKVVIADNDYEKTNILVKELGKNFLCFEEKLTSPEKIDQFIKYGVNKFGKIDAFIHSAYPKSIQWGKRFEDIQPEWLSEDLFNQLGGAILFSQRVVKYFLNQGYGNLIHISSIQGISAPKFEHYQGTEMTTPIEYSAIKSGIISITRYLAKYYKNKNIRINCISPGGIIDDQPQTFKNNYNSVCNSKGLLDPEDLNGAMMFLLSNQSKYINGQNIIVDDGWSL